MKQIEIDNEVFAYLQDHALVFVDNTPNLMLRRLFQLDKSEETPMEVRPINREIRKRQRKVNLPVLINSGLIEEGQQVFLVNYRGGKLSQYSATIIGSRLRWQGKRYSMSNLAQYFLQKEGNTGKSVRGPAHWCTEANVTIKKLWQRHLHNRNQQVNNP